MSSDQKTFDTQLHPGQGVPIELVPEPWRTMCRLRESLSGNPSAVEYLSSVIAVYGPGAINVEGTWHIVDSRSDAYGTLLEVHRIRQERAELKDSYRQISSTMGELADAINGLVKDMKAMGRDEQGMTEALINDITGGEPPQVEPQPTEGQPE